MTIQASAYLTLNPSFIEPEFLLQYSQASGFIDTLAEGQMRVRLAEDDLLVYMKQLNLRTKMSASQAGAQELPGVEVRAIRQVAEGEGRILRRVSSLMWLVTFAALFAAALAVGATSATTVLERRSEIGLMKAIGASRRTVAAFFLA